MNRSRLRVLAATVTASAAVVAGLTGSTAAGATAGAVTSHAVTYTLVTEPGDGYGPIYNLINSAQTSLDMTMYELTDTTAEQDLVAAAARGVTVRVILDQNLEKSNNTSAYNYLSANGVQVHWAWSTYAATHEKAIVVDGANAAIMTGNLTSQYYSTSRDFAVLENNSYDVKAIEKVFNADFASTAITPTDGYYLVWSPTDSQTQILGLINSATKSLSIENEEMAYATVTTALENAAQRGVDVEVTMTNDAGDYATEFDALTAAGVHVHTYAYTASLYIHAKAIVADYGTSAAKVDVGSQNFSNASWNKNRELGFISANSSIVSSINATLAADYAGGTNWS